MAGPTGGRRSRARRLAGRPVRRRAAAAFRARSARRPPRPARTRRRATADVHAGERHVGQQRVVLSRPALTALRSVRPRPAPTRPLSSGGCSSSTLLPVGQHRRHEAVQHEQVESLGLGCVVAGTDARDLGVRSQAECALDEDVAVADEQHARRAVAAEDGPGGVVEREAVGLVEAALRGCARRPGRSSHCASATLPGSTRIVASVEAIAVDLQRQRGGLRLASRSSTTRARALRLPIGRRACRARRRRGWRRRLEPTPR